jgi:hypothetical protein
MNAISQTNPQTVSTPAIADTPPPPNPVGATEKFSGQLFSFSAMLADYLLSAQKLKNQITESIAQGFRSQWHIQKTAIDAQNDHIDKTFEATKTSGICEIVGGGVSLIAAGVGSIVGVKSGGNFVTGMEMGTQFGSGVVSPFVNGIGRVVGGAHTAEASDAQMRADLAKTGADAQGRLISTLADDAAAIRQEYLSMMRTLSQMQMELQKCVEMPR